MKMENELWIDTRLQAKEMDFLNQVILESKNISHSRNLAGNVSKSEVLEDKDDWFYETVLKKLTERMFYRNWDNYYKYHIEKEESLPKFKLTTLWVNHQKQHEFNPLHDHGGLFSFVIFMRIPTHWEEQHALPISANSNSPSASNFQFVWPNKGAGRSIVTSSIPLSPEDEGRMLFFPATLRHQVFPFYGTEEERVTISGNIVLYNPNEAKLEYNKDYDVENIADQKKILEIMEQNVIVIKKELEKASEKK